MRKENNTVTSSGVGFTGLLAITFIILKFTHVIDWTWFWVLSPIWIPIAFYLVVLLIAFLIVAIKAIKGGK